MRALPKEGIPGHLDAKKRHFPNPSANRTLGALRLARATSCRTWFWFERPATFFGLPCLMICPAFSCFFFANFMPTRHHTLVPLYSPTQTPPLSPCWVFVVSTPSSPHHMTTRRLNTPIYIYGACTYRTRRMTRPALR